MNTPNNKRKKESIKRIEKVFIELIQTKELDKISVSDICKRAKLNRTTFYANYTDIYGWLIRYEINWKENCLICIKKSIYRALIAMII